MQSLKYILTFFLPLITTLGIILRSWRVDKKSERQKNGTTIFLKRTEPWLWTEVEEKN